MVGQLCYVGPRPSWAGLALGHRTESQILWLKDLSVQSRFWKPEQTVGKGWGRCPRISYLKCVPQEPLNFTFSVCGGRPAFPCLKQPTARQKVQSVPRGVHAEPGECRGHIKNLLTLKSQLRSLIPSLKETKSKSESLLRAVGRGLKDCLHSSGRLGWVHRNCTLAKGLRVKGLPGKLKQHSLFLLRPPLNTLYGFIEEWLKGAPGVTRSFL